MHASQTSTPSAYIGAEYIYATLPEKAPSIITENAIYIRELDKILPIVETERKRQFSGLVRRYIQQILNGCNRTFCDTPTCNTTRRRLRPTSRPFTSLSARILACELATADDPYKALCPGIPSTGTLSGARKEQGLKDIKSFTQQLFDTTPLRKLEWLNMPPPCEGLRFVNEGEEDQYLARNKITQEIEERRTEYMTAHLEDPYQSSDYSPEAQKSTTRPQEPQRTPQHHQPASLNTPHQIQAALSPPSRPRRSTRVKSTHDDDRFIRDINTLLSSPTSLSKTANELDVSRGPFAPSRRLETWPQPPSPPSHRQTQTTPSRPSKAVDGTRPAHSPASTVADQYTLPPQVVSFLDAEIVDSLLDMCTISSESKKRFAELFTRQSIWYVLTTPEALCKSFLPKKIDPGTKLNTSYHPLEIDSVFRKLIGAGFADEIFKALWKCVECLFPIVAKKGKEGKKLVLPSTTKELQAAKIVLVCLHALAAFLPKASPEEWEETRKTRGKGEVSNIIIVEDNLCMRLTSRLVRALAAYRLFTPSIDEFLDEHLRWCAKIGEVERKSVLETELGPDLASAVNASGIGMGGWSVAICSLEWVRGVILAEWDGENELVRGGVVESGIGFLKFLYDNYEAYGLNQIYFQNPILTDRLDLKDTAVEWFQIETPHPPKLAKAYVLDHAYLFPPASLVTFFRSINFHLMSKAYDTAVVGHRFVLQMAGVVDLQNYLEKNLFKRLRVSMTPYFVIEIRRPTILKDALDQVLGRELRECTRPLKVRFLDVGEEGIDHGGVQQEFFLVLMGEALQADYGMFTTDPVTHMSWFAINPLEPLHKYELLGILVSLAVYNGVTLPITFPKALYRKLLGYPVTDIEHIEDGWPDLARGLRQLLEWKEEDGNVEDVFMRGYEFSYEAWGRVCGVDMLKVDRGVLWEPVAIEKAMVNPFRKLRSRVDDMTRQLAMFTSRNEIDELMAPTADLAQLIPASSVPNLASLNTNNPSLLSNNPFAALVDLPTTDDDDQPKADTNVSHGDESTEGRASDTANDDMSVLPAADLEDAVVALPSAELDNLPIEDPQTPPVELVEPLDQDDDGLASFEDIASGQDDDESESPRDLTPSGSEEESSNFSDSSQLDELAVLADVKKGKATFQPEKPRRRSSSLIISSTFEPEDIEAELVTSDNREAYVRDYIFWLTDKSVRPQFEAFQRGFNSCLNAKALTLFNPSALQHLVEGIQDIDIAELEKVAKYDDGGWHADHPYIREFWSIVRTYSPAKKRQLLEFVTASDRVPVNGLGTIMFCLQKNGSDSDRLPTSLTCYGRLLLPEYSSKRKLKEKMRVALENAKGFGVS